MSLPSICSSALNRFITGAILGHEHPAASAARDCCPPDHALPVGSAQHVIGGLRVVPAAHRSGWRSPVPSCSAIDSAVGPPADPRRARNRPNGRSACPAPPAARAGRSCNTTSGAARRAARFRTSSAQQSAPLPNPGSRSRRVAPLPKRPGDGGPRSATMNPRLCRVSAYRALDCEPTT